MTSIRLFLLGSFCSLFLTPSYAQEPRIVIDSKGHTARINNLHFSSDGNTIISVSEDKTIKVWNVETGKMIRKFESEMGDGPEGMFYTSDLSPDGKLLAVAGYKVSSEKENYVIVIDLENGKQFATAVGQSDIINSVSFSGNGNFLASGSADGTVNIYKVATGDLALATTLTVGTSVSSLSFNSRTQDLAVANDSRDILLFPLAGLNQGATKFQPRILKHHKGAVNKVTYSPDGLFLASSSTDNELALWRQDGTVVKDFGRQENTLTALAFSFDSKLLVGLDVRGLGSSWAIPGGNRFSEFKGHDNAVFCAAFSRSLTNYVVASAGGLNNEIILWNPINGVVIRRIKGFGNAVEGVAFHNGYELLISQEVSSKGEPIYKTKFDFATLTMDRSVKQAPDPRKKSDIAQTSENTIALGKGKVIQTDPNEDGRILDFQAVQDGSVIVASDFSLKMFDKSGLPLKEFIGHFGAVRTISVSSDGVYLASGSEDQSVILWRLAEIGNAPTLRQYFNTPEWDKFFKSLSYDSLSNVPTKKAWSDVINNLKKEGNKAYKNLEEALNSFPETVLPFATLFLSDDNEWVCWSRRGYFACSSNGGQYFGWHINHGIKKLADYYSADQYFDILFRPKEFSKSIQQAKPVEVILKEAGERTFDLKKLYRPSAAFFDTRVIIRSTDLLRFEKDKIYTQAKRLPLIVEVYDGGGGVHELNIFQNDKLIINDKDVKTKGEGDKIVKTYEVEMVNEVNEFKVVVINHQKIESRPDFLTIEYKGEILVTSTLHVLAIGINKYQNEAYNLNYAQPDAKSFVDKINEKGKRLFKNINEIEIYDEEATRENIMLAFKTVSSYAKPEDVFLFYYAGHGTIDEDNNDEYYLVPTNITKLYGDPEQLGKKGISATELRQMLTQVKSQKQVILMDACHSGGAVKSLSVRAAATDEKAIIQLARSSGVVMIASSGTKQFATEFEELKHGVFTYALIEALDGLADTGDKKITVNELKFYMEDRVPDLTKQYGGKTQYPTGYITGNDFPLVVID